MESDLPDDRMRTPLHEPLRHECTRMLPLLSARHGFLAIRHKATSALTHEPAHLPRACRKHVATEVGRQVSRLEDSDRETRRTRRGPSRAQGGYYAAR
jgi:hypothetical protein